MWESASWVSKSTSVGRGGVSCIPASHPGGKVLILYDGNHPVGLYTVWWNNFNICWFGSPSSQIFNIRSKSFFHDYYFLLILFHKFHKEVAVTCIHRIAIQREPVNFAAVSNHRHMFSAFFYRSPPEITRKLQAQGTDHQVKGKLQSFGRLQAPKPRLTKIFSLLS